MMRISLGYPDSKSERELLRGVDPQQRLESLESELSLQALKQLQDVVGNITVSDQLLDYFQRLITFTRESGDFSHGLSTRAALAWLHCAKAWALIHERQYVMPEDIQQLMLPVVGHRLLPSELESIARNVVDKIIQSVPVVV
jgi:MoxR-like ATPase